MDEDIMQFSEEERDFLVRYNLSEPEQQREVRLVLNMPTNEDAIEFLSSLDNFKIAFSECEEHPEIWMFVGIMEHTVYINRCATEHDQIKIIPTIEEIEA